MKTPALPRPFAAARLALVLLALAAATAPALSQTGGQRAYSPNNPLDIAQRELDKAETDAVRFDPQSPERNALEGRAQQLRQQMAESVLIYGAGVKKPGLYPATPGLKLTGALKLAGGITADAVPAAQLAFASPRQSGFSGIRVNLSGGLEAEPPYDPATAPRRGQPGAGFPGSGPPRADYDYAIAAGDSIRVNATEFRFEGGTPKDFLKAIDAHYLTDWQDLANIPPEAAGIKVPKIKTPLVQNLTRRGGTQFADKPATALLELYNALAADQPAMGKWKMSEPVGVVGGRRGGGGGAASSRPAPPHPDLILPQPVTRPDQTSTWLRDLATSSAQSFRVKALSLAPIPRLGWEGLVSDIPGVVSEAARLFASEWVKRGATSERNSGAESDKPLPLLDGRAQLSPGTGVLLVIGTPEYIDFVESFVAAKRSEAERAKNP